MCDAVQEKNKFGSPQFGSAATESSVLVDVDDNVGSGQLGLRPKSKRTRTPIDRLVVGDPRHFGNRSKKA